MRLEAASDQRTPDPAAFGFERPPEILEDILRNVSMVHGYGDAKGLLAARRAVVMHNQTLGIETDDVEHVLIGNGVSELIVMAMQGLLDDGDEVLVPAPDYPLWTAAVSLSGRTAVHHHCDEQSDWMPDLADVERKVTDRTKAIVIINPNNPTGAVYDEAMLRGLTDIARRHNLLVCSDEIYDKILYLVTAPRRHPDRLGRAHLLTLTFNGMSKAYRVAGYRVRLHVHLNSCARRLLYRGPDDPREHAPVREHARSARRGRGAQRAADDQRPGAARRPTQGTAGRRLRAADPDPGRELRETQGRRYLLRLDPKGLQDQATTPNADGSARREDHGRPGDRLQLALIGPLPGGHPAERGDPDPRGDPASATDGYSQP